MAEYRRGLAFGDYEPSVDGHTEGPRGDPPIFFRHVRGASHLRRDAPEFPPERGRSGSPRDFDDPPRGPRRSQYPEYWSPPRPRYSPMPRSRSTNRRSFDNDNFRHPPPPPRSLSVSPRTPRARYRPPPSETQSGTAITEYDGIRYDDVPSRVQNARNRRAGFTPSDIEEIHNNFMETEERATRFRRLAPSVTTSRSQSEESEQIPRESRRRRRRRHRSRQRGREFRSRERATPESEIIVVEVDDPHLAANQYEMNNEGYATDGFNAQHTAAGYDTRGDATGYEPEAPHGVAPGVGAAYTPGGYTGAGYGTGGATTGYHPEAPFGRSPGVGTPYTSGGYYASGAQVRPVIYRDDVERAGLDTGQIPDRGRPARQDHREDLVGGLGHNESRRHRHSRHHETEKKRSKSKSKSKKALLWLAGAT